ncbi:MAG: zinc ribbon domain-containing protein [Syntrophaceae bacterium]|nr:zinc ribbon domain-containing protein [Syntrophaceae bacterium]
MAAVIPIIMKIISIIFLIFFILSVVFLVFTFRKPKKVSMLSLILPIVISLITFAVFSFFVNYKPSIPVLVFMGSVGLCIGILWSQSTRVYIESGTVMSHNSIWYLVVWGTVFALTQLIFIVTQRPPSIIMALLIMSTASIIGMNGRIMQRYFSARSNPEMSGGSLPTCSRCGASVGSGSAFCNKCGNRL